MTTLRPLLRLAGGRRHSRSIHAATATARTTTTPRSSSSSSAMAMALPLQRSLLVRPLSSTTLASSFFTTTTKATTKAAAATTTTWNSVSLNRMHSMDPPRYFSSSSDNNTTKTTTSSSSSSSQSMPFQAETRQLLDIVTNSLYTDKEVFLRELVSNASDALEKLRHVQSTGGGNDNDTKLIATSTNSSDTIPLAIYITANEEEGTLTIRDTGIGLTKQEMIDNLGTIARSGSKAFLQQLKQKTGTAATAAVSNNNDNDNDDKDQVMSSESIVTADGNDAMDASKGIIGKFGVGFYSAFMVGEKVEVKSQSALMEKRNDDGNDDDYVVPTPHVWSSDGTGSFEVAPLGLDNDNNTMSDSTDDDNNKNNNKSRRRRRKKPNDSSGEDDLLVDQDDSDAIPERGSSIIIHLKPDFLEYSSKSTILRLLKKYSNFVNFPIYLNDEPVNTIQAVWSQDPRQVKPETYIEFYKYVANAVDEPLDTLHFRADAPVDIKALLFIPSFHSEKYGMGRMEPGVSLYCRKVLIEHKSSTILPEWMRFVRGVVDSEDLPLSVSREKAQDSLLVTKLRKALTRKFISHLTSMAKKDSDKYMTEFYPEYAHFLKEGVCHDYEVQQPLAKLLYFESSKGMRGDLISLDEYISRVSPEQKDTIYYLCAPNRDMALQSPYMEAFTKLGYEVIFVYNAIDDFVMANLETYEGRKLVSAEHADVEIPDDDDDDNNDKDGDKKSSSIKGLDSTEAANMCSWFKSTLSEKVSSCTISKRLGSSSPAVLTDNESGAMRRMMRMVDQSEGGSADEGAILPKQKVELNPKHPIIIDLYKIRETEPTLALVVAEQIYDNCLMAAGLLDDGQAMLPRLNDLLTTVLKDAVNDKSSWSSSSHASTRTTTTSSSSDSSSKSETSTMSAAAKKKAKEDKEYAAAYAAASAAAETMTKHEVRDVDDEEFERQLDEITAKYGEQVWDGDDEDEDQKTSNSTADKKK